MLPVDDRRRARASAGTIGDVITADEVLEVRFRATKFDYGYDQDDVDDFLDRVVATLRSLDSGEPTDHAVGADDVRDVTFQPTRFREGYDLQQVDEVLDRVQQTLRARGASASTRRTPPAPPAPADARRTSVAPTSTPPAVVEHRSWWSRLFGG